MSNHLDLFCKEVWKHKGKIIGALAGLYEAAIIIRFGFWKGLLVFICVLVGFFIGARIDSGKPAIPKDDLRVLLQPKNIRTRQK
jgi:uncharacterized membrane protein